MICNRDVFNRALSSYLSKEIDFDFCGRGFCQDTRLIRPGQIFVAIKGNNNDGNDFAKVALEKGAAAVVTENISLSQSGLKKVIVVNDVIKSIQKLASFFITINKPNVIAVTGSCGKTTTKNMLCVRKLFCFQLNK